jgi:hypothetical protein
MSTIKKMVPIGFILSIVWILGANFIYFDSIINYPHSIVEHYHLPLYDFFESVHDSTREKEALQWAKDNGTEHQAKMFIAMGFEFIKPVFSLSGYLKFVFLPVILTWISVFVLLQYNPRINLKK